MRALLMILLILWGTALAAVVVGLVAFGLLLWQFTRNFKRTFPDDRPRD